MGNDNLQDIKISGSGNISGGEYNNVKISGSGQVCGNIKAEEVRVSGSGGFKGNIASRELRVSGSLACDGSVVINKFIRVSGSGKIKENLTGKEVVFNGSCGIGGNVKFKKMVSRGTCEIDGDCEGDDFTSLGYINVNGLLAADKINIMPEGNSYIKEIGGEEIEIKAEKKKKIMFFKISFGSDGLLNCDIIEGDRIILENTKCKIVRGDNITIGKCCEIDKIEYSGELNITDEKSIVGEKICMKN